MLPSLYFRAVFLLIINKLPFGMESWYPVGNLCNLEGRLVGPLEVQTSNHARCSIP